MLFFPSALIPQLCLYFFQKLKYNSLGNKDYSRKKFWVLVTANVNADEVRGAISLLIEYKALVGFMTESTETILV